MCTEILPSHSYNLLLRHHHKPPSTETEAEKNQRMATMTGVSLSCPRVFFNASASPQNAHAVKFSLPPSQAVRPGSIKLGRVMRIRPVRAAPERISEKVEESIKSAEEACSGAGGDAECVAAWDEVEELSAAASHARDKQKEKDSDPLENYCKDNPETIECKTFED